MDASESHFARVFGLSFGGVFFVLLILNAITF
jgi:hypothetical protein